MENSSKSSNSKILHFVVPPGTFLSQWLCLVGATVYGARLEKISICDGYYFSSRSVIWRPLAFAKVAYKSFAFNKMVAYLIILKFAIETLIFSNN